MSAVRRKQILVRAAVALAMTAGFAAMVWWPEARSRRIVTGAVLVADSDQQKQRPIVDAEISAVAGEASGDTRSDQTGFFRLTLDAPVPRDQQITLSVKHPGYRAYQGLAGFNEVQVVRLTPAEAAPSGNNSSAVSIANVRVRYAFRTTNTVEVASAAKTFDIVNTSNTPCANTPPCSPDGRWKAARQNFTLDAGKGRQFRNTRVSCLSGPCPFTKVESNTVSDGGQQIGVSVLNWADTVTYLVEAEVVQTMVNDLVRHSFPVIFGSSMNFTLPPLAQGPSIEAEVNGEAIVFPLGPKLRLSWASCRLEQGAGRVDEPGERQRLYRCDLKPGYRFRS
jgi:hypothetical protein